MQNYLTEHHYCSSFSSRYKRKDETKKSDRTNPEPDAKTNPTFDHPERESFASYAEVKQEAVYTGLDSSQQQPSEYQDLVHPIGLKTVDDYMSLDDASRQAEQEYQDLDTSLPCDPEKKRSLQVPIPPKVETVESGSVFDGPYVNVTKKKTVAAQE